MATYMIGQDGLPVPESMQHSKRSLVRGIFASTPYVTLEVARLWARSCNTTSESAVSRAVSAARDATHRKPCTRDDLKGVRFRQARRRLALLNVMGLIFPGMNEFKNQRGYVLLPSDSQDLVGTQRSHPFGVLILGEMVHVFAESEDLRGAARGIHEILIHFHECHLEFKCCIHLLYRSLPPIHHETFNKYWPLLVSPGLLAYWQIDSDGFPTHLEFLDPYYKYQGPKYEDLQGSMDCKKCSNWIEWLELCTRVRATQPSKMRMAEWLKMAPSVAYNNRIAELRQAAHKRCPKPHFARIPFDEILSMPEIKEQFEHRLPANSYAKKGHNQCVSINDVFVPEPERSVIPD